MQGHFRDSTASRLWGRGVYVDSFGLVSGLDVLILLGMFKLLV